MFVSTMVSSTLLNVQESGGVEPYNFSLPYNFVRGRNLTISLQGRVTNNVHANVSTFLYSKYGNYNCQKRVVIPDNVTEYTTTVQCIISQARNPIALYELNVTFDITNSIITFTPISVTNIVGAASNLDPLGYSIPVLITVNTNL